MSPLCRSGPGSPPHCLCRDFASASSARTTYSRPPRGSQPGRAWRARSAKFFGSLLTPLLSGSPSVERNRGRLDVGLVAHQQNAVAGNCDSFRLAVIAGEGLRAHDVAFRSYHYQCLFSRRDEDVVARHRIDVDVGRAEVLPLVVAGHLLDRDSDRRDSRLVAERERKPVNEQRVWLAL